MKIEITETVVKDVKYLKASCGVRYWEDGKVNGVEDTDGSLIPCRRNDCWEPTIDLETGIITNWEAGKTAKIHYKVCDAGVYTLLDDINVPVKRLDDSYVISSMSPGGPGYGDYVIMNINEYGKIDNWKANLSDFVD